MVHLVAIDVNPESSSSSVYFGVSIIEILFIIPKTSNFIKNRDGNRFHISVKKKDHIRTNMSKHVFTAFGQK